MIISELQMKILFDINEKKVRDLKSFYSVYIPNPILDNLSADIIGFTNDQPDLPKFCSIANSIGIVLSEEQQELVCSFIDLWEKCNEDSYIRTVENKISPYSSDYACFIPVNTQDKRSKGKFNNPAFHMSKTFLDKEIVVKDDLNNYLLNVNKTLVKTSKKKKRVPVPQKTRALLQKEVNSICPICKSDDVDHFQPHHIDEDPSNNKFENLLLVCPLCHSKITKGDISRDDVIKIKENLKRNEANTSENKKNENGFKIKGNIYDSIIASTITTENIIFKGKTKPKVNPHPNSIEANLICKNYIKHLIDRYQEFIKEDHYKGEKRYTQIWGAIKKEFGASAYKIPQSKFDNLVEYLQKRIKDTKLGRILNKRGQKLFSTFEEYKERYT